jgi:hypothetical protein
MKAIDFVLTGDQSLRIFLIEPSGMVLLENLEARVA